MRIAERPQVRMHYPDARDEAIDHTLYTLHRAVPHIEQGRPDLALAQITGDVLAFDGDRAELAVFGIPHLLRTLPYGRTDVSLCLDQFNLLHRDTVTG